jgi:hypothetical protein
MLRGLGLTGFWGYPDVKTATIVIKDGLVCYSNLYNVYSWWNDGVRCKPDLVGVTVTNNSNRIFWYRVSQIPLEPEPYQRKMQPWEETCRDCFYIYLSCFIWWWTYMHLRYYCFLHLYL